MHRHSPQSARIDVPFVTLVPGVYLKPRELNNFRHIHLTIPKSDGSLGCFLGIYSLCMLGTLLQRLQKPRVVATAFCLLIMSASASSLLYGAQGQEPKTPPPKASPKLCTQRPRPPGDPRVPIAFCTTSVPEFCDFLANSPGDPNKIGAAVLFADIRWRMLFPLVRRRRSIQIRTTCSYMAGSSWLLNATPRRSNNLDRPLSVATPGQCSTSVCCITMVWVFPRATPRRRHGF